MRVACIQMCSDDDVAANLNTADRLLTEAASRQVNLAVLPENFSFMGNDNARKHEVAHQYSDTVLRFLSDTAMRLNMAIVGGSMLLESDSGRLRNSCPVYTPDGSLAGAYGKMHLFDVDLPEESYRESDVIEPGNRPVCINAGDWRLGLSICYDIRFPELYRYYAAEGCNVLTVPAAFTVPTGKAHWEVLLRARAIENQCYVLAAGQYGVHPGKRKTYGHSMIIDPWGETVACLEDGEGMIVADLVIERVNEVRSLLPALKHRRAIA